MRLRAASWGVDPNSGQGIGTSLTRVASFRFFEARALMSAEQCGHTYITYMCGRYMCCLVVAHTTHSIHND